MTVVRLFSAADVHRPGPAGPKLRRDRSRQWRGRRSGVLAGRGDDQRREQPKRGRLPVRRGQSHRQRGPPLTPAERTTKTRSQCLFVPVDRCEPAPNISTLETHVCQNTQTIHKHTLQRLQTISHMCMNTRLEAQSPS